MRLYIKTRIVMACMLFFMLFSVKSYVWASFLDDVGNFLDGSITRSASVATKTLSMSRKVLPNEAIKTLDIIKKGPPYLYMKDGTVFKNREGYLPKKENGYYKEFTVETPGETGRGARRIVQGKNGELYYTDDHYKAFKEIIE